jgi:hypothetical protein
MRKAGRDVDAWGVKQGSASNRPSPRDVVRFDNLGFFGTTNPGWRGRSADAFVGRCTPGYLLSGLQPEEPGNDGLRHKVK